MSKTPRGAPAVAVSRAALRRESRRLQPLAEGLRRTACLVEKADVRAVRRACDDAYALLSAQIIPHVAAQSVALASIIDSEVSALSRDCRELITMTHELGVLRTRLTTHPSAPQADELRRVLFGLYALVRLQFTKAEEVYLPMLDALGHSVVGQGAAPQRFRLPTPARPGEGRTSRSAPVLAANGN
ncbi:MAG: hypothetical protein ABJC62_00710 [Frankiaceae bacterium]